MIHYGHKNETSETNEAAGKRAASYVEAAHIGDRIRIYGERPREG